jgi:RloB-like protein
MPKPLRKSGANKAWNKKPASSSYRIGSRKSNKTILIVCEGQTEELYFKAFPVVSCTVKAENLKGQSKLKLVESTRQIVKESELDYDEIWCVFDMDVKQGGNEFEQFDNAVKKAENYHYKVAYSNDVFELWFYLHYQFTDQKHHRTFYYEELGKLFGISYEGDGKKRDFCLKLYDKLKDDARALQERAIKNAKKLLERQQSLSPSQQNPITLVFELVEELNQNLRP